MWSSATSQLLKPVIQKLGLTVKNEVLVTTTARITTKRFETVEVVETEGNGLNWQEYEYEEESTGSLYTEHYPTTTFQKSLLALGSSVGSLVNVHRGDMVAVFGEVTGQCAFRHMLQQMENSDEGRRVLEQRPRINTKTVDYQSLLEKPEKTFGYAYSNFMKTYGLCADDRPPVHFVDDVKLAYVAQRYREVHDLFHVLLGMPTTMLGEVTVKWVEAFQTRLPMAATGGLFGAVRLKPKHRQLYVSTYLPWALRTGFEAKPFMPLFYEERWDQDITDLRQELLIPSIPPKQL